MVAFVKASLLGVVALSALALAGCQTTPHTAGPVSSKAVKCNKCEITYVSVPETGSKNRVIGYKNSAKMECPECRTAAQNFFDTGKLVHTCTSCAGTMETCEGH